MKGIRSILIGLTEEMVEADTRPTSVWVPASLAIVSALLLGLMHL